MMAHRYKKRISRARLERERKWQEEHERAVAEEERMDKENPGWYDEMIDPVWLARTEQHLQESEAEALRLLETFDRMGGSSAVWNNYWQTYMREKQPHGDVILKFAIFYARRQQDLARGEGARALNECKAEDADDRAIEARRLRAAGWKQVNIADHLGISQSAVSRLLKRTVLAS
jgi:hypothetical protein